MKNILELLKKGLKLNNKIMTNIFLIISIILSLTVLTLDFNIIFCSFFALSCFVRCLQKNFK